MPDFQKIFDSFNSLRVLIIGDVMLDSYVYGKVERISPEAPVPIVAVEKRENRLGGAANVALNIAALGASPILCSIIGDDLRGDDFINLLEEKHIPTNHIFKSPHRITTTKYRIIGNNAQMLRVDEEVLTSINEKEAQLLLNTIESIIKAKKTDVIIFEDYDKGLLEPSLISKIVDLAIRYGVPVAVDPKKKNFFAYKNVTLFKPNLKELREGLKLDYINPKDFESIKKILLEFGSQMNVENVLVTLSEAGLAFAVKDKTHQTDVVKHIPAHLRNIADVSGAGDTVISVAALGLALGLEMETLSALANLAGGIVCEEIGAVPVSKSKLLAEAISKLK